MPESTRRGASGCSAHPPPAPLPIHHPPPAPAHPAACVPNALPGIVRSYYSDEDLTFVNGILGAKRLAAAGFEQIKTNHLKRGVRKPAPSQWEATQHRRMSGLLDHPRWDRIGR